jgi:hypothetical protein
LSADRLQRPLFSTPALCQAREDAVWQHDHILVCSWPSTAALQNPRRTEPAKRA